MLVDITGAFAGRKNDHMKQNESRISQRLVECQFGNIVIYNTATDKGCCSIITIIFILILLLFVIIV